MDWVEGARQRTHQPRDSCSARLRCRGVKRTSEIKPEFGAIMRGDLWRHSCVSQGDNAVCVSVRESWCAGERRGARLLPSADVLCWGVLFQCPLPYNLASSFLFSTFLLPISSLPLSSFTFHLLFLSLLTFLSNSLVSFLPLSFTPLHISFPLYPPYIPTFP